jgi:hypothetical protein
MSEEVRIGGDESNDGGIEVPGDPPTALERLVDWTNQVRALQIASALFPSLEAVIDADGYCGPVAEDYAEEVFRYLDEYCVELDLLPSLDKKKALVYVQHHRFDVLAN